MSAPKIFTIKETESEIKKLLKSSNPMIAKDYMLYWSSNATSIVEYLNGLYPKKQESIIIVSKHGGVFILKEESKC